MGFFVQQVYLAEADRDAQLAGRVAIMSQPSARKESRSIVPARRHAVGWARS
jgi:hypothetical protein